MNDKKSIDVVTHVESNTSRRKSARIITTCLLICITGAIFWLASRSSWFPQISPALSREWFWGTKEARDHSVEKKDTSTTTENSSSVALAEKQGIFLHDSANRLGLFNATARDMIRSNSLAKIDYAMSRLLVECQAIIAGNESDKQIKEYGPGPSIATGEKSLITGNASDDERRAAHRRSYEKCAKFYDYVQISPEEMAQFRAMPNVKLYQNLAKELYDVNKYDRAAAIAAFDTVISEPMLGRLQSLAMKLDLKEVYEAYPPETVGTGHETLVMTLLLCKMGDDCDRNGIVTDQLCWLFAICGNRVDEAVRASLSARGIDPAPLDRFVNRLVERLQARDMIIFGKPK
jgi:hypothetical protein